MHDTFLAHSRTANTYSKNGLESVLVFHSKSVCHYENVVNAMECKMQINVRRFVVHAYEQTSIHRVQPRPNTKQTKNKYKTQPSSQIVIMHSIVWLELCTSCVNSVGCGGMDQHQQQTA